MINAQNFVPWVSKDLPITSPVSLERIEWSNGLAITVREETGAKRVITLSFSDLPNAMRIANESYRLKSLPNLPAEATSFYIVENSEFMQWFHDDSLGIYASDPIFHLAIVTDEWIDLICNEEPRITLEA